MKVYLIRHGATKGNRERRYVGSTDEPLLAEEIPGLQRKDMPPAARIYASPMRRCIQTAAVLYPGREPLVVDDLAGCSFGDFEYCNYEELNGNPDYQKFIDSMGRSGFPGGEGRDEFQRRCLRGFYGILQREKGCPEDIALVVHGGTIMAILDVCSRPHRDYYDWQIENGGVYAAEVVWEDGGDSFYLENIEKK